MENLRVAKSEAELIMDGCWRNRIRYKILCENEMDMVLEVPTFVGDMVRDQLKLFGSF